MSWRKLIGIVLLSTVCTPSGAQRGFIDPAACETNYCRSAASLDSHSQNMSMTEGKAMVLDGEKMIKK